MRRESRPRVQRGSGLWTTRTLLARSPPACLTGCWLYTCPTACRLVDVDMNKGTVLHPYVWSLGAFWPGLQVCGDSMFC